MLDVLPVTANGKVDETLLPPPREVPPTPADAPAASAEVSALQTAEGLAGHLAGLWSAELDRAVGVDDNVFDLGGIVAARYLEALCILWVLACVRTGAWNKAFKLLTALPG